MTRPDMHPTEPVAAPWWAGVAFALLGCLAPATARCQSATSADRPVRVEFKLRGFPTRWHKDLENRLGGLAAELQRTMYVKAPWLAHWKDRNGKPVSRVLRATLTKKGRIVPRFHLEYEFDESELMANQPLGGTTALSANPDKLAAKTRSMLLATFRRVATPDGAKPTESSFYPYLRKKVSVAHRVLLQNRKCVIPISFADIGIRDLNDAAEVRRRSRFRITWQPTDSEVREYGVPDREIKWRFDGSRQLTAGDRHDGVAAAIWERYSKANDSGGRPHIYAETAPASDATQQPEGPPPALDGKELTGVSVTYLPPKQLPKSEPGTESLDNPSATQVTQGEAQ